MTQFTTSIPAQRQQQISDYLKSKFSISIKEASELCNVSEATARRDLDDMAAAGLLERTHGGAVLHKGTGFEEYHDEKMKAMIPEKTRIAREAVRLIKDGDSIFLDSGTNTLLLGQQLEGIKKLTVVTNNLDIASTVKLDNSSTMIVTGGVRRDGYSVLIGDIAEELVRKLYVDIAFVGADAVNSKSGVYNSNFMEIGIKKSMIASGKRTVLLADHSKFKQKALAKICDIEEFDTIITDSGIEKETREYLDKKIPHLIVV